MLCANTHGRPPAENFRKTKPFHLFPSPPADFFTTLFLIFSVNSPNFGHFRSATRFLYTHEQRRDIRLYAVSILCPFLRRFMDEVSGVFAGSFASIWKRHHSELQLLRKMYAPN